MFSSVALHHALVYSSVCLVALHHSFGNPVGNLFLSDLWNWKASWTRRMRIPALVPPALGTSTPAGGHNTDFWFWFWFWWLPLPGKRRNNDRIHPKARRIWTRYMGLWHEKHAKTMRKPSQGQGLDMEPDDARMATRQRNELKCSGDAWNWNCLAAFAIRMSCELLHCGREITARGSCADLIWFDLTCDLEIEIVSTPPKKGRTITLY